MRKQLFVSIILLTAFFAPVVYAQSLISEKAYQDYQYNRSLYDQSYSDYQDAKNAYLANQTLGLKREATQKTLVMLRNRDQLMIVYLTLLRTNISELPALEGNERDRIYGKIDNEVNWYKNHKKNYNDDDQVEDLFTKSGEAKNQYTKTTLLTTDETLFDISIGQEKGLRQEHEQIYSTLRNIIDAGVAKGTLTLSPFNHWFNDVDSTIQVLKTNEDQSRSEIQKLYDQSYSSEGAYGVATTTLSRTRKPLSQLNEFLSEVAAYIKNQQ